MLNNNTQGKKGQGLLEAALSDYGYTTTCDQKL